MKRVSSSDVSMKLLPAEEADMTDVELSITKGKQIKGSLSAVSYTHLFHGVKDGIDRRRHGRHYENRL